MKIIALYSPYPQMGKNSFADHLGDIVIRTETVSFADHMREVLVPLVADFFDGGEDEVWQWLCDSRKDTKLVPGLGVTLRHMLRTFGTEWGRKLIHPDLWVMKTKERIRRLPKNYTVVVDDMRMPNEYHMLRKEGATLVRIERKATPKPAVPHESDALLEGFEFDYHVSNDGDVEELRAKALLVAKSEGVVA